QGNRQAARPVARPPWLPAAPTWPGSVITPTRVHSTAGPAAARLIEHSYACQSPCSEQPAGFAEQLVQLLVDLDVDLMLDLHVQIDVDWFTGRRQLHLGCTGCQPCDHHNHYRQTPMHMPLLSWAAPLQIVLLDPLANDLVNLPGQLQTGQQGRNVLFQAKVEVDRSPLLEGRVAALQAQAKHQHALLIIGQIAGQYLVLEVVQRQGQLLQVRVAGRQLLQLLGLVTQHTGFPGLQPTIVDHQLAINQAHRETPIQGALPAQSFRGVDLEKPGQFDTLHHRNQRLPGLPQVDDRRLQQHPSVQHAQAGATQIQRARGYRIQCGAVTDAGLQRTEGQARVQASDAQGLGVQLQLVAAQGDRQRQGQPGETGAIIDALAARQ